MTESEAAHARMVGINHVALDVGSIEDALEFYGDIFDFDIRGRTDSAVFLDMGDQFLALSETGTTGSDSEDHRHLGLVVDDPATVERRLDELDAELLPTEGVEFHDPWGNRIQVVGYEEIQFTKADHVLDGMGLSHLEKEQSAIAELAEKGMAPE